MTIHSWQRARRLVPVVALLSAACDDRNPTSAAQVPLDNASATAVQVNVELALMRESRFERAYTNSERRTQPVVPWFADSKANLADDEPRTIVKHFKQSDGKILSLGLYFRKGGRLPAALFSFEDGKIRTAVGLGYTRHGTGHVRRQTRVTTFDASGRPSGRVDIAVAPIRISQAARPARIQLALMQVATDVLSVFAPQELHAEEVGPCSSEYLSYLTASIKLAAAIAAVEIAGAACLTPGTQPITCPAAGAAFLAFSEALDKWSLALDKLIACTEAAKKSGSTSSSGGTFTSGGTDVGDDDIDQTQPIEQVVREFIDDAVESGQFFCTEDGEICIFYAE